MPARAGDGGAGVFLYQGGTLSISSGAGVQGGNAGRSTSGTAEGAAGVLSNQGQVLNAGTITGGSGGSSAQFVAGPGAAGVEAWGGSIRN
ncbi:hypothetical protein ACLI1W_16250, partial [Enterococcus faecalis]